MLISIFLSQICSKTSKEDAKNLLLAESFVFEIFVVLDTIKIQYPAAMEENIDEARQGLRQIISTASSISNVSMSSSSPSSSPSSHFSLPSLAAATSALSRWENLIPTSTYSSSSSSLSSSASSSISTSTNTIPAELKASILAGLINLHDAII